MGEIRALLLCFEGAGGNRGEEKKEGLYKLKFFPKGSPPEEKGGGRKGKRRRMKKER